MIRKPNKQFGILIAHAFTFGFFRLYVHHKMSICKLNETANVHNLEKIPNMHICPHELHYIVPELRNCIGKCISLKAKTVTDENSIRFCNVWLQLFIR